MSVALGCSSGYQTPETDFYHRLQAGDRKIGTVGLNLYAFAVAAIWRTLFKPAGMTLVVTESASQGRRFVEMCEQFVFRNEKARYRVWIGNNKTGLCEAHGTGMHMVHVRPADLMKIDPVGDCLILIPNIDVIPGTFLKLASDLVSVPGVSLAANAPKHVPAC